MTEFESIPSCYYSFLKYLEKENFHLQSRYGDYEMFYRKNVKNQYGNFSTIIRFPLFLPFLSNYEVEFTFWDNDKDQKILEMKRDTCIPYENWDQEVKWFSKYWKEREEK